MGYLDYASTPLGMTTRGLMSGHQSCHAELVEASHDQGANPWDTSTAFTPLGMTEGVGESGQRSCHPELVEGTHGKKHEP